MLDILKNHINLLIIIFLIASCGSSQEENNEAEVKVDFSEFYAPTDKVEELTQQQELAFDALNTIQTSTDERNRFYATFANTFQACYPPDTSFILSQAELLKYMKKFVSKHCQNLEEDVRIKLAETSVLAQEKYTVFYCNSNSLSKNHKNELPTSGTWIMPGILGHRDVIMVWQ